MILKEMKRDSNLEVKEKGSIRVIPAEKEKDLRCFMISIQFKLIGLCDRLVL